MKGTVCLLKSDIAVYFELATIIIYKNEVNSKEGKVLQEQTVLHNS